jgi:hypothetical protein
MRTAIAILAAMIALSTVAHAKSANSGYAGSGSVSSRPIPTPPRVQGTPTMIKSNLKLNCYHTRERNKMGIYVHRTHCG